ncbi:cytochrome c biogenesis protein ResB [Longirhabdus pacifica]|uniref:cytochrome c biogenesis protein ResB n=1 Tax=Longirhabdus pacifica TaxID=2305227 RepID=UPI001008FF9A|nr:cytochrome c biogenesis protein ResB [Longirhabdus pacifica]
MKIVQCECGHNNPYGTQVCEICGNPFDENEQLLNMRYEGAARRSQTYNTTIVDKIWNFFSSVKVGIWLIVLVLLGSVLGTVLPQQQYILSNAPPETFYEEQYGWFGWLYYTLGFHELFKSWWFLLLLALLGLSLIVASLDRIIPLYRSLKKQRVTRNTSFLKRQRLFSASEVEHPEESIQSVKKQLEQKRYKVKEENGNVLAEKNRFSRWGPYVNHTGLVIVLFAAMLRFIPGMYVNETVSIREGEYMAIPGTNYEYYLENEEFSIEYYDPTDEKYEAALERINGLQAKTYQTDANLYRNIGSTIPGAQPELEFVKSGKIIVNEPFTFDSISLYQTGYGTEFYKMMFQLANKETGEQFGTVEVNLDNPQEVHDLGNGYKVKVLDYFPDFEMKEDGPATKSKFPNNPGIAFSMISPEHPEGEISFVAIRTNVELGDNDYKMEFISMLNRDVTQLTVKKDHTLWLIALGGFIFMIGLTQGMYWNHRRVWLQQVDGEVWIAAHTNRGWDGFQQEITQCIQDTKLSEPVDQDVTVKKSKESE